MEVITRKDHFDNYEYNFIEGQKYFKILFSNNQDLYWSFDDLTSECGVSYGSINITKDNPFIYNLFDQLYSRIKDANPLDYMISTKYNPTNNMTRQIIDTEKYTMYQELFDGKKITWISDDRDYDKENSVTITKKDDYYAIEFYKKPRYDKDNYYNYWSCAITIRFRNSGSHYKPFNVAFMEMYNNLNGYSTEYGQMPAKEAEQIPGQQHLEDYAYTLKKEIFLKKY